MKGRTCTHPKMTWNLWSSTSRRRIGIARRLCSNARNAHTPTQIQLSRALRGPFSPCFLRLPTRVYPSAAARSPVGRTEKALSTCVRRAPIYWIPTVQLRGRGGDVGVLRLWVSIAGFLSPHRYRSDSEEGRVMCQWMPPEPLGQYRAGGVLGQVF
ncbi:unnamed protein product [Prunus armeniaca]|uniref:Uncharacterized protein n=1 Tax=Prunus armeniaca TaxID=36596 RepID=A0A6J5WI98_PRUAR|nr:unnamed protein product [Prunus armeniaca]